ncbi:MAG: YidH family protein [Sphingomonas sp.]
MPSTGRFARHCSQPRNDSAISAADRDDLAEDRTDLAEDRTLLASERTFSGWARTAMAAIGIGLGFNALFQTVEPTWVPKAIATAFIALAIFIIVAAERRARDLCERLTAHQVKELEGINLKIMAIAISAGAASLIVALWVLA